MFDFNQWHSENDDYLSEWLGWLRTRLRQLAHAVAHDEVAEFESAPVVADECEYLSALDVLAAKFQLSGFEKQVMLLCAAMELDTRIPALCAAAQGNRAMTYPTASLCFSLLDDGSWDLLSPDRPLRRCQLIEVERSPQIPLTASPLRVDDRIISYVKGLNFFDERMAVLLTPLEHPGEFEIPPSQAVHVERIIDALEQASEANAKFPIVQLLGVDSEEKTRIANAVADQLELRVHKLNSDLIPRSIDDLDSFIRLWRRESRLVPLGLYLDLVDAETTAAQSARRLADRTPGIIFLDAHDQLSGLANTLLIDVRKPTPEEQLAAWSSQLPDQCDELAQQLTGQFSLNAASIERVLSEVDPHMLEADGANDDGDSLRATLWDRCRVCTRPKLEELAQRVDVKATWSDIVLPPEQVSLLKQLSAQVRFRGKVLDEWGFRGRANRGLGITSLFAGESGTGKTMAAEVIANELQLDLYRIDLSSVVNKYIGETEKNLRRLFDAAEDGGSILFFDEADALFGKRTEVKDSHDRFANIEVNYLLQRMESYQGLAILATNNKQSLDTAFLRRLRFIVDFSFPDATQRMQIWQRIFPMETPLIDLDYKHLAKMRLSGGNICNIALNAAFSAASRGPVVDMPAILDAARNEMIKTEKPLNVGDFHWAETSEFAS